jgi:hypothetical protein
LVSFTGPVFWLLHALALAGALGVFFLVRCAVLAVPPGWVRPHAVAWWEKEDTDDEKAACANPVNNTGANNVM